MPQGFDDMELELTIDHPAALLPRTQQPPSPRNAVPSRAGSHRELAHTSMEAGRTWDNGFLSAFLRCTRSSQKSLGETVPHLWVSTVAPWSFVPSGDCSLGTSNWTGKAPPFFFKVTIVHIFALKNSRDFGLLKSMQGICILRRKLENCLSSFIFLQQCEQNKSGRRGCRGYKWQVSEWWKIPESMWYEEREMWRRSPSSLPLIDSSISSLLPSIKIKFSMRSFQWRSCVQVTLTGDPLHPSTSTAWTYS